MEPNDSSKTMRVRMISTYGTTRYEPISENAFQFLKLAKQKTFTPNQLETLKGLGYRIVVGDDPIDL